MQNKTLTPISQLINESLKSVMLPNTEFKPNAMFYSTIGINKHRFAKIMRNEVEPTRIEIKALSDYFKINPKDLF
ncbi:hypothetical protein GCM10011514_02320 [Emticicia aquatilis]|uniref:Uncharacterized protein n=1 Tax=Emticicia aquatilis TaxID=1537369 RepID=A0A917DJ36_9BACT|nr:hypothetical protein [Emticicia aquatilis]GGD41867.1 hypothetical protein GCM10011514_02320 [Emticicia aquatilis]